MALSCCRWVAAPPHGQKCGTWQKNAVLGFVLGSFSCFVFASFVFTASSRLRFSEFDRAISRSSLEVRLRKKSVLRPCFKWSFSLCSSFVRFSHFPLTSLHLMRCFISPQQGAIMLRVEVMPGRGLGWGASVKKPHPRFFSF